MEHAMSLGMYFATAALKLSKQFVSSVSTH
jgi:hypothetical protein